MQGGNGFDPIEVGAKGTGLVLLGLLAYRTLVFVCNFLAGRYDARQARVEALDEKVSASLAKRLDHLEAQQAEDKARIGVLESWVAALASELRANDPENPRLKELSDALRHHGFPIVPPDPSLRDLLHRGAAAVERTRKQ
jgi:hypothetical protein